MCVLVRHVCVSACYCWICVSSYCACYYIYVLLSLSDDDARVCYLRAIAYARQGKPTQSLQAFDAACALNEDLSYRAALDPELSELIKNR